MSYLSAEVVAWLASHRRRLDQARLNAMWDSECPACGVWIRKHHPKEELLYLTLAREGRKMFHISCSGAITVEVLRKCVE